jgi:hypothetical protein
VTEELVDLSGVLQGLRRHGIEFLVFGSAAMLFYGSVRAIENIEVVVSPHPRNMHRLYDWLVSIDACSTGDAPQSLGPTERWAMLQGGDTTVTSRLGRLELLQRLEGMPDWPDLVAESEVYERDGLEVRVINRETLIAVKGSRGSQQDLADIEAIRALEPLDG